MNSTSEYDTYYATANHYHFRKWIYGPFVRALIGKSGIKRHTLWVDIGCGQGQFTALLAENGLYAMGVDASNEGVLSARRANSGMNNCVFRADNALTLRNPFDSYDGVFCRAFSLYNVAALLGASGVTEKLISYLIPGGAFIWTYPSRLQPLDRQPWQWHTLEDARTHFKPFGGKVYFTLRLECRFLGKFAFNPLCSWIAETICKLSGHRIGGELVAIVRK